ncbi:uncharacterized protein KY384_000562 [Bacidia gigantensis]|uniref:uncharacterized protein n=1 Tax=Bacidia gigantensis TaxID=2732470 RepID=UPI001D03FE90|nr:uncharacterized protein KY384_000562 [Bacidia gigantensis]KAG8525802.1 hypothetical protein KY384_000562 [Bacidia gigantensis]
MKPDQITKRIDEIMRLKPAKDFNSKLDRIMRLGNVISTFQVNWNLTQQPDIPMKERYGEMLRILDQRIAQDAKQETPRWTSEERQRFLRLMRGHGTFGFVSKTAMYSMAALGAAGAFYWVALKFEVPDD